MAQPPQQPPPKPPAPKPPGPPPTDKSPPPLRDPAEGKPPAVLGGNVTKHDEEERDRQRPTIGVKGEPIEDGERDPDTIAEEQRRRSAEMEAKGVEPWKDEHDERTREEREGHRRVEGAQARLEDHKAR